MSDVMQYQSLSVLKLLNAFIPITRFNKGEAGKIIDEVKKDGPKVIIKNNAPECVMISVEEYNRLTEAANRTIRLQTDKKFEARRKKIVEMMRAHVEPPLPPSISLEERIKLMDSIGPIEVDEEAVNELRRISMI